MPDGSDDGRPREVPAGTAHTFATVGEEGAEILCVMTPEIDELISALHGATTDETRAAVWARYRSHLV